ncbi:MAG TPA: TonB family protein [Vicinamibacterales bacterium]|nr:TonB family protein [Vicinamibacterales bacterium]
MSVLLNDARFGTRAVSRRRSSGGLWLSVVAHAAIAGVLMAIVPTHASENPSMPRPRSIGVFHVATIEPTTLPPVPVSAPHPLSPLRPSSPVRTARIEEVHEPAIIAPIAVAPLAAAPVVAAPATLPAAAPAFERPRETALPVRPPETGLFERANSTRPGQSGAAVTTGGFESVAASQRAAAHGGDDVRTAGFDRPAPAPVQSTGTPARKPIDRPLEILFKPVPEYTDEARSARIEGTVALDLEFTAAGEVRVLRVVSGLGHGLDEAAERAASRIRFTPAQSDGRAVVSRATVYITFRLS